MNSELTRKISLLLQLVHVEKSYDRIHLPEVGIKLKHTSEAIRIFEYINSIIKEKRIEAIVESVLHIEYDLVFNFMKKLSSPPSSLKKLDSSLDFETASVTVYHKDTERRNGVSNFACNVTLDHLFPKKNVLIGTNYVEVRGPIDTEYNRKFIIFDKEMK